MKRAHTIRHAIKRYLADKERKRVPAETVGASPDFGASVPSRDEWARG